MLFTERDSVFLLGLHHLFQLQEELFACFVALDKFLESSYLGEGLKIVANESDSLQLRFLQNSVIS